MEDKQAGISCKECGYEAVVTTKEAMLRLSQDLLWVDGDPICQECGNRVWFEDYLEENQMSKSFIELEKQYQKLSYELRHTLEKLAWYCSDFEVEEVEYVINPYNLSYGEEYLSHWVVNEENMLYVNLRYEDPYDDYDTDSHVRFPLHWVEHAYNDTLEEIDTEIKSEILKFHHNEMNSAKRDAIFQAKEFGLITEEQAKIELEKL